MTRQDIELAALLISIILIVVVMVGWIAHIDQSNCVIKHVSYDGGQFLIGDRCARGR